jgi:hypothetical protein
MRSIFLGLGYFTVFKSTKMGCAGHVARLEQMFTGFWSENMTEDCLGNLGVAGRIILKLI